MKGYRPRPPAVPALAARISAEGGKLIAYAHPAYFAGV